MRCPYCSFAHTQVTDTRETESAVRRRRLCAKCRKKFTTYEQLGGIKKVLKRDGRIEDFNRNKIKAGMVVACSKRPVTDEMIEKAVLEIEAELSGKPKVSTAQIGKLVLKKLNKIDKVCCLRFASVHKKFEDVKSFEDEIDKITKRGKPQKKKT